VHFLRGQCGEMSYFSVFSFQRGSDSCVFFHLHHTQASTLSILNV
jgi:hypothetical protein